MAGIKLSIIIPVYNVEKYLSQCLTSVLGQSLRDIEIICVDDGSTDHSLDILNEYAARDSRVTVLRQKNQHAGVARNYGMSVAKGEYIHFLDADDYVLDYAYEAIYNKALKYNLDCLKFMSVPFDVQRNTTVNVPVYLCSTMGAGDFNRLLTLEEGSPIYRVSSSPWTAIYRLSFLRKNNAAFNSLLCINDRSFFNKVVTNAKRMMISRDRLVVHRINQTDSLVGKRAENFDCHFQSIRIVHDQLVQDQIDSDIAKRIMKREFSDLFEWYRKFCHHPSFSSDICERTEEFVNDYNGLFSGLLRSMYEETLNRVSKGSVQPAPPEEIRVMHEECASPKVSVVLPVYNVEDYLNEALYSLSVQTLDEMEFLCVNDGSTDGSMTILKEYANIDKRFRILDGPNGGYGKAMNRGIDEAKGKYLGILETDDFVPGDMYRSLYQIAEKNDLDLVKADFYVFTVQNNGTLKMSQTRLSHSSQYYNRVIRPADEQKCFTFPINTWSGIYRMDFLNHWHIRHNETPGASYQDNGFWFQTFCRAERAWFVDRPYYRYRRDNPNASTLSTSKVYCVTEEFRYIWEWMNRDPELVRKFSKVYYRKKFNSFMVVNRRIDDQYRREYIHHIKNEFAQPMRDGLLDQELFGEIYWKELTEILADPEEFYGRLRVSVIIPVYNAESYVRDCLDSILAFTDVRMEVICIDDGSSDHSPEILREYEKKDPRVKILTQKNAGAGAARNVGMKYAKGEYLSFLDADDFFEPGMLRWAYEQAHTFETDITVFRCDRYLEEKDTFIPADYTIKKELLPQNQPFAGTDIKANIFGTFMGWAWDKLFRTDFVRQYHLQFQEQRTTNDMLFVFSALVKAKRIKTMDAVLAHHRSAGGTLSVTREQSWDCFYHALCALRKQLTEWGLYKERERDFINYSLHFSLWNLLSLRGSAYQNLYKKLSEEWFEELKITDHEAQYFYNPDEWRQLQQILHEAPDEFLFSEIETEKQRSRSLQKEVRQQENKNSELQRKIKSLENEKKAIQEERKAIKNSVSWRVARTITWLPRKIKKIVKKNEV